LKKSANIVVQILLTKLQLPDTAAIPVMRKPINLNKEI